MATNLLLEGDDLEALLIKAHSEGGPNARIVRADKYRHGGLWGFFARERFEVAVEIPATDLAAAGEGSAFFVPSPAPAPAPDPAPDPAPARDLPPAPGHLSSGHLSLPEPPEPAAFAADGLLGIADRVSAAERAAAERRVRAATDSGPHIDLPVPEPEPAPVGELVGAGHLAGSATWPGAAASRGFPSLRGAAGRRRPSPDGAGDPGTHEADRAGEPRSPAGTPRPAGGPGQTPPRPGPVMPPALAEALSRVPHEPGVNPVQPSTSRPEFTALLDTLRDGARPARTTPAGAVRSGEDKARAAYLDEAPYDGVEAQAGIDVERQRPARATTDPDLDFDILPPLARTSAFAPDQPAARIPAQPGPATPEQEGTAPEIGEPRRHEAVEEQSDERTVADRAVLHRLGVPTAWTRRLRPGDRFTEVLRMLERMPEQDIDPATTVVAVVGPPGVVRIEAHRTALDLALGSEPRPVVVVPASVGTDRAAAIARALRTGPVVLAVESDGEEPSLVLDTLTTARAGAVIAVVDATEPIERTQRWLDALGRVDALALDGATEVPDPAAVLQLGLPVVRLDGISVDRVTWTALLCAQLLAAGRAEEADR